MTKISALPALSSPADGDLLPVVDVSDTSQAATGTTKRVAVSDLTAGLIPLAQRGAVDGVATLDSGGQVPASELGNVPPAYQPWQFRPESYGAKGDGTVAALNVTNGSTTVTAASAVFTSTAVDGGKHIMVHGANGSTSGPLITTIATVTSPTTAVLAAPATATVSGCPAVFGSDDTAAINAAIAAAKTYALSHEYFFEILFSAAIYILAAAPVQTTSPVQNAQIPLPYPAVNGTSRKLVISLKGAGNAGHTQYWLSTVPNLAGTSLVSMQTAPSTLSPTYGEQSVIGGPSGGGAFGGAFANTKVFVDGITVWAPIYTNMYGWDFGYLGGAEWGSFSAQVFAPAAAGVSPRLNELPPQGAFQATRGVGCRFPLVGNNDDLAGASFTAQGFNLPVIIGDHFTCLRLASVYCDASGKIDLVNGISGGSHAVTVPNWSAEAFNGGLLCNGGGGTYCHVDITLDTEPQGGGDPVYDISDSGGALYGQVRVTDNGSRPNRRPVVTGAAHLKVINGMMGPGIWTGAPAVPASGTAAQNTAWRDAHVYLSGGTVTGISVDGTSLGVTSGPVRVPGGHTITLTYSSAPTWKWVLD